VRFFFTLLLLLSFGREVRYFPSILYGHILIGTGTSRYETVFTITASSETRVTVNVFTDKGERMNASFIDERGKSAGAGSSFECYVTPDRPVKIKLALAPDEAEDDVAVKTGWATVQSAEEVDITAVVRVTTPDGKLLTRHVLVSEKPPTGE
jgi:hypothetical protein